MNEAEYAKAPGIRWTHLRQMAISPAHYQAAVVGGGLEDTRDLRIGRAIHSAALEPDEVYRAQWITWPGTRSGKDWKAFEARALERGQEVLNATESAIVTAGAAALRRSQLACDLLRGKREQMVSWLDRDTGLRCKAKPDVTGKRLVDLKSAKEVSSRPFGFAAARFGYHGQLAYYFDGVMLDRVHHLDLKGLHPEPVIVAVEKSAPWDVVCFEVSESILAAGRALYKRLLFRVLECEAAYGEPDKLLEAGEDGQPVLARQWPGRSPDKLLPLELPEYAYAEAAGPLDFGGVEVSW